MYVLIEIKCVRKVNIKCLFIRFFAKSIHVEMLCTICYTVLFILSMKTIHVFLLEEELKI